MPLPPLDPLGDLPPGVHAARLAEVIARFGASEGLRGLCTRRLVHLIELARRTGHLKSCVVFGSYVTAKTDPNDVDVVLVMDDNFRLDHCPAESRALYDHALAQARFGASIFWIRPGMLLDETLEDFIEYWQITRSGAKRGIVNIIE
jgi:hypothetical protein